MLEVRFEVYWCVLDGADWSRQFVKMHFHDKNPAKQYTGGPRMFIMDPKHNIKKIRNNIEKSNKSGKPRCLQIHGKEITWTQFKSAFDWDQKTFSLPLHEKLTMQHFDLDSASKMRNRLAEDVLDTKMLFLMQKYKESVKSSGEDDSSFDAVISLLEHTSKLVSLFNDRLYITCTNDIRLQKLNNFYNWMCSWEESTQGDGKLFISSKLWFDLKSMCLGFQSLVHYKLLKHPSSVIKPAIVNQDCVENHFCQIRSCNGQNDNPTFLEQQSSQNSIRLGQTTISPKSNASCSSAFTSQRPSIPSSHQSLSCS